jgi:para-nitrobenzyl esterase
MRPIEMQILLKIFGYRFWLQNFIFAITLIAALALVAISNGTAATPSDDSPIAVTISGKVRGYIDNGINAFRGIPYGENTANRRFLPPVPPQPWSDVRDALKFGLIAPQQAGRNENKQISEDCLSLNVYTPALRDGRKRPVMVWFHGGAYSNGTSNENLVDGVRLCRRGDVVVVGVNHRLNVFGYLYLAQIGGTEYKESGNVGMLDLVLALKWVRDNILEFGGDPNNVTIFGQSGGGAKCATLSAMPAARGLFHRIISESGQQVTGRKKEAATATARTVLKNLRLTPERINELKTIPMEKLIKASRGLYFGPVTDGNILPRDPFDPDASPLSADIPMMMGNTHDETAGLIGGGDSTTFNLTWDALPAKLEQYVKQFLGSLDRNEIIAEYRRWYPNYTPSDAFFSITTAARSWRSLIIESERRVQQGGAPTYVFQLNWKSPMDGGKWRAAHAMEIPFVFDNVKYGASQVGIGVDQQKMADIMSEVWIAFARTGNPDTPAIPHWPTFDLKNRPTMIFDLIPRVENNPRGQERLLFAPVQYVQPGTL